MILRGPAIADEFRRLVDDYVESRYPRRARGLSRNISPICRVTDPGQGARKHRAAGCRPRGGSEGSVIRVANG